MRCRRLLVAVLGAALLAAPGCGARSRPLDTTALVAELGLDGAAEALRIRIASEPGDVAARRALAGIEDRRGRPGAVLAELEAVRTIGGPFGVRLSTAERARLAELYRERARVRASRGSPDALADLDTARDIAGAGGEDAGLRSDAMIALAIAELRHSDPDQRARGAARMGEIAGDPRAQTIADPEAATPAELAAAGVFLWRQGARRAGFELLDAWERASPGGGDPEATELWLTARAWWGGVARRPDLATLDRAIAAGASPCHFARSPGEHGCSAAAVMAAAEGAPDGHRLRSLIERSAARGWRTADPDEATAWVVATAQAWRQGLIPSWLDAIDARVDLAGLGVPADGTPRLSAEIPAWARAPLLRAAGHGDQAALALDRAIDDAADLPRWARSVLALEAALVGRSNAELAAILGEDALELASISRRVDDGVEPAPLDAESLVLARAVGGTGDVVIAFRRDPAAGDRAAEDAAARSLDLAGAAAALGELFELLGDPARARAWWQRAVDSSPRDPWLRTGLVRALAAAGDGAAARLQLTTAAAESGDPAAALLAGARALAAAGLPVDALPALKLAIQLTAPGEQQAVLGFAIELALTLDRADQLHTLRASLAAQQTRRDPTTLRARALAGEPAALSTANAADPTDAALAVQVAASTADDADAVAILARALDANRDDLAAHAAVVLRAPVDSPAYLASMHHLAELTGGTSRTASVRSAAARAWLAGRSRN